MGHLCSCNIPKSLLQINPEALHKKKYIWAIPHLGRFYEIIYFSASLGHPKISRRAVDFMSPTPPDLTAKEAGQLSLAEMHLRG